MTAKHPTKRRYVHFFQSVKTTCRSSPTHTELEASLLSYRHVLKPFPLAAQPLLKGLLLLPHFCLSPFVFIHSAFPRKALPDSPLSSSQLFCPRALYPNPHTTHTNPTFKKEHCSEKAGSIKGPASPISGLVKMFIDTRKFVNLSLVVSSVSRELFTVSKLHE